MANNNDKTSTSTTVDEPSTKLYRLLQGSITRYEGVEDKAGTRKVVTYEANGDRAGNLVWLTEKEVAAVNRTMPAAQEGLPSTNLRKLEEVHGATRGDSSQGAGNSGTGKIAAPPAATSLTGAPAGGPMEDEPTESEEGDAGGVNVGDAMTTAATPGSGNPAVDRVLAKKAASK